MHIKQPDEYPTWMHRIKELSLDEPLVVYSYPGTNRQPALAKARQFRNFRNSLRLHASHSLAALERNFKLSTHVFLTEQATRVCLSLTRRQKACQRIYKEWQRDLRNNICYLGRFGLLFFIG